MFSAINIAARQIRYARKLIALPYSALPFRPQEVLRGLWSGQSLRCSYAVHCRRKNSAGMACAFAILALNYEFSSLRRQRPKCFRPFTCFLAAIIEDGIEALLGQNHSGEQAHGSAPVAPDVAGRERGLC